MKAIVRYAFAAVHALGMGTFVTAGAAALDPALPDYEPRNVAAPQDARYLTADGAVRIMGADGLGHLVEQFNRRFAATHPGTRFSVNLKGTSTAIPALTHGVTAFAPMGRQVTANENVPYAKIVGAKPLEIRVAHGSVSSPKKANVLAVFVNKSNPLERLTVEQAARIFGAGHAQGDLTQWGQLGLQDDWRRRPIHTYGAYDDGGFAQYMLNHRMEGLRFRRGHERLATSAEIVKRVAEDPAGIGYAAISYATPGVKVIALAEREGGPYSAGAAEDVGAGRYPYDRYVYFYVRRTANEPLDPFVKEYLRLVLSRQGQQIIAAERDGYVPLNAREVAAELAKLD